MWAEIAAAQPRLLGALLDALVVGIANLPTTRLDFIPRMADFALLGTAAESGLGWERGAFLDAYVGNRQAANDLALEYSPVAEALFKLVESGPWIGTARELLKVLTAGLDEHTLKQNGWPSSPRGMRGALERLAPNLRAAGVEVDFLPRRGRSRVLEVRRIGSEPASTSSPSPPSLGLPSSLTDESNDRPSPDGGRDGMPSEVTDDPGRSSPATAVGEGAGDRRDGGDGQAGPISPEEAEPEFGPEPELGTRPEKVSRPSGSADPGSWSASGDEDSP